MFITIHCGGMAFDGNTIKEKSLGGSETAAYYMAKELAAQGHKVTLFTNTDKESESDGVKYIPIGRVDETTPLGHMFHFYASNTPHDVLIMQRHPMAFKYKWESKINLLWLHDLALHRSKHLFNQQMWNIDGVLTVSQYHKEQVVDVYGLNPDIVYPITNGVDLSLYENREPKELEDGSVKIPNTYEIMAPDNQIKLLYSSRPERGLENHVKPGGIMERLAGVDPRYHLYVCAYENTTAQMKGYYDYLNQRCDELPNVTRLGSLTKQELADVMRQCDALVYPTKFEEVSCITAMEAMAAGLPFISSAHAALPETCFDSGSVLIPLKDGEVNIEEFISEIKHLWCDEKGTCASSEATDMLATNQLLAAKKYSWGNAANRLLCAITLCFHKYDTSHGAKARQLMRDGDIYALQEYINLYYKDSAEDLIFRNVVKEFEECYDFVRTGNYYDHYQAYYAYEKARGVNYGPEDLSNNSRFLAVCSVIDSLGTGATVLDYGCAHGHYTINLAKQFPDKHFIGVDITASNIEKAKAWAKQDGITNVEFYQGYVDTERAQIVHADSKEEFALVNCYDAIIAAEVLEHLESPAAVSDTLESYLVEDGQMIITTPFGPWEYEGAREHHPWRAHVHHLERADLHDLWGNKFGFTVTCIPNGPGKQDELMGSYMTTYNKKALNHPSGVVNYERKFSLIAPRQTASCCMIVKDAEASLRKTLLSVGFAVDEIVIAIDNTTSDRTKQVIENYKEDAGLWPLIRVKEIDSPLASGFDEARNESIADASGDWIIWIDADEEFNDVTTLYHWFKNNQYNGYAIKQHHFSVQPLGVLKTDFPCRVFRNHAGIKFFGLVHEHPEKELNKGVGHVMAHPFAEIIHPGYSDEMTRRNRFKRNINLLREDRKENPNRTLGKFLWIRDLTQLIQFELEMSNNVISKNMKDLAQEGVDLFKEMLTQHEEDKASMPLRYIQESMSFYSSLCQVLGSDIEMGIKLGASKMNGGVHLHKEPETNAFFDSVETMQRYANMLLNEKTEHFESRYF